MSKALEGIPPTQKDYAFVARLAREYILAGGGITTANCNDDNLPIDEIGTRLYDLKKAYDAYDAAMAQLDHDTSQKLQDVHWEVIWAREFSAFVFGCSVGLQLTALQTGGGK